ncbi:MAG: o-succinylbenzoate synthase [Bacteroidota bacterium]
MSRGDRASRVAAAEVFRYRLPLIRPLALPSGTHRQREGVLLRVRTEDGAEGWGEAAPLPGYSPDTLDDVLRDAQRSLPGIRTSWIGSKTSDPDDPRDRLAQATAPSWACAVEQAVHDVTAMRDGRSLADEYHRVLGRSSSAPSATVHVNALLTGPDQEQAASIREMGYRAVKLKVGRRDPDADAAAVRQLASSMPDTDLRLDANGAWTLTRAVAFAEALGDVRLAYVEEPLADPKNLAQLLDLDLLPVALDESIPNAPRDGSAALIAPAVADRIAAVVLKPTLGRTARRAARLRAELGRRDAQMVISSAFESGVGMRHLVAFASALGETPAGLDTYRWLAEDVTESPLPLLGPSIEVAAVLDPNPVAVDRLIPVDL